MTNRVEIIAAACHSAWCAFELGSGRAAPNWEEAEPWQREISLSMVALYDSMDLPESAVVTDQIARLVQNEWCRKMAAEGWNYGSVKDAVAKTHPAMIPYQDFVWSEKVKHCLLIETYLTFRKLMP